MPIVMTVTVDYDVNSTFAWTEYDAFDRARLPFTGTQGRQVPISDTEDVMSYFNLYFTEEIIAHIVEETNRRAQQLLQDPNPITPNFLTNIGQNFFPSVFINIL